MIDFAAVRRNMVDTQLRTYDVNSKRLLDAVDAVPRELFLPPELAALAYADQGVPLRADGGDQRVLLQPMVLARMIQSAEIEPGDKALAVAGGTGYGAAVMAAMGASVTLLESDAALAEAARRALAAAGADVAVVAGDLAAGHAGGAPYDVIVIEGAVQAEPAALLAQLTEGGRLVAVVGAGRAARVVAHRRTGGSIGRRSVFDAAASSLAAFREPPSFRF